MRIGVLTVWLHIPGCRSLKEKRRRLKPLLFQLRREFNVSVAEIDAHDAWQRAVIACAVVSNEAVHAQQVLQSIEQRIASSWREGWVENESIAFC